MIYRITRPVTGTSFQVKAVSSLLFLVLYLSFQQPAYTQAPLSASALSDTSLSLQLGEVTVFEFIKYVSLHTKLRFSYINNKLPLEEPVQVDFFQQPLRTIFDSVFHSVGIDYVFISDRIVVLKQRIVPVVSPELSASSSITYDSVVVITDSVIVFRNGEEETRMRFFVFDRPVEYDTVATVRQDTLLNASDTVMTIMKTTYLQRRKTRHRLRGHREGKPEKFTLQFLIAPGAGYRALLLPDSLLLYNNRNDNEYRKFDFYGGVRFAWHMSRHFMIRSGVLYLNVGENGKQVVNTVKPRRPFFPRSYEFQYKTNYNYLAIPLSIGFTTGRKAYIAVLAGADVGVFLNYSTTYPDSSTFIAHQLQQFQQQPYPGMPAPTRSYRNPDDPREHPYRKLNLLLQSSVEIGYRFSNRMSVFIAPSYNVFLYSIYSQKKGMSEKPYCFNAAVGFNYSFGKRK